MVLGVLQARMSSTRLPEKVLRPILGRPMLARQLERVADATMIDTLAVATSTEKDDDPIEQLCSTIGISCYRGSLPDVLDRYYGCAQQFGGDTIVRLTGDCPLADPDIIDQAIVLFQRGGADYVSNSVERTFPRGLDVEVFSFEALETSYRHAKLAGEREHVTPYIYTHPLQFSLCQLTQVEDMSHHRWTVDEPEDFEFVSRVYETLYPRNPRFRTADILKLLEQEPNLISINAHIGSGANQARPARAEVAR
ncbi:MAG: glycosyltransferase family protein [Candidatus Zixiibacteriota bacterium]